jgi:hypothetical protein
LLLLLLLLVVVLLLFIDACPDTDRARRTRVLDVAEHCSHLLLLLLLLQELMRRQKKFIDACLVTQRAACFLC